MFQFPKTRFTKNPLWRQWLHLLSEVLELGWDILRGDLQHAGLESWDVCQSGETLRRILMRKGVNIPAAKLTVLENSRRRGTYEL